MANKRKYYRIPGSLLDQIDLVTDSNPDFAPSQIYKEVERRTRALNKEGRPAYPKIFGLEMPDPRTVQKRVKALRPPDPSGPWEPAEWDSSKDVSLVLEVIKCLGENGQLVWPTRAEADHILWIRETAPTLPLELVWMLTRRRIIHEAQQLPAQRIGWYLAFKPWENEVNKELYFKMVPERERIMYPIEASGTFRVQASATAHIQTSRSS